MIRSLPFDEDADGFTLIELLIVVIIIGILAAIAIPIFLNQRRTAVTAGLESDVRNMAIHLETAATMAKGTYPSSVTDGTVSIGVAGNVVYKSDADSVIEYHPAADGNSYVICASNARSTAMAPPYLVYDTSRGGLVGEQDTCP